MFISACYVRALSATYYEVFIYLFLPRIACHVYTLRRGSVYLYLAFHKVSRITG